MKGLAIVLAAFALLIQSPELDAQSGSKMLPGIEDLMSAKEFEAAGLLKLTPGELSALNVWLRKYTVALSQTDARDGKVTSGLLSVPAVIESYIDGEFNGWDGETIFKLRNGQIWQQSSYAYTYHYAYAPKVLIYSSGGGYKMKVDGVSSEIAVRRLK